VHARGNVKPCLKVFEDLNVETLGYLESYQVDKAKSKRFIESYQVYKAKSKKIQEEIGEKFRFNS
jgi:hypothetical protein